MLSKSLFFIVFFFRICNCVEGNITNSFRIEDYKWCCKTSDEECTIDKVLTNGIVASVTCKGRATSLQDQCTNQGQNLVCNDYPEDRYRNYHSLYDRSYINICKNDEYGL